MLKIFLKDLHDITISIINYSICGVIGYLSLDLVNKSKEKREDLPLYLNKKYKNKLLHKVRKIKNMNIYNKKLKKIKKFKSQLDKAKNTYFIKTQGHFAKDDWEWLNKIPEDYKNHHNEIFKPDEIYVEKVD